MNIIATIILHTVISWLYLQFGKDDKTYSLDSCIYTVRMSMWRWNRRWSNLNAQNNHFFYHSLKKRFLF